MKFKFNISGTWVEVNRHRRSRRKRWGDGIEKKGPSGSVAGG